MLVLNSVGATVATLFSENVISVSTTPFTTCSNGLQGCGDGPWTFWAWTALDAATYTLLAQITIAVDSARTATS